MGFNRHNLRFNRFLLLEYQIVMHAEKYWNGFLNGELIRREIKVLIVLWLLVDNFLQITDLLTKSEKLTNNN